LHTAPTLPSASATRLLAAALLFTTAAPAAAEPDPAAVAWAQLQTAIAEERWGDLFDGLSRQAREGFEMAMGHVAQHARAMGVDAPPPSARDSFARIVPKSPALRAMFEAPDASVTTAAREDSRATLRVVPRGGEPRTVQMVKEEGAWKLDLDLFAPAKR
jgi:hypothetical protein